MKFLYFFLQDPVSGNLHRKTALLRVFFCIRAREVVYFQTRIFFSDYSNDINTSTRGVGMSRDFTPKGKLVRRFGANVVGNPKYDKLLERKKNPPGPPPKRRKRESEYGKRLIEKQKLRYCYGLTETQMRRLMEKARKSHNVTGQELMCLLEQRLDNAVYRTGMAQSRAQARQMITHGHFAVNGVKVKSPGYMLRKGDKVAPRKKEKAERMLRDNISKASGNIEVPKWLDFSKDNLEAEVERTPIYGEDFDALVDEQLVIEFYSR